MTTHQWVHVKTNKTSPSEWRHTNDVTLYSKSKWSLYKCKVCQVDFLHRYDVTESLSQAYLEQCTPIKCIKPEDQKTEDIKEYEQSANIHALTLKEISKIEAYRNTRDEVEEFADALKLISKNEEI
jgi:hypothetical protein